MDTKARWRGQGGPQGLSFVVPFFPLEQGNAGPKGEVAQYPNPDSRGARPLEWPRRELGL